MSNERCKGNTMHHPLSRITVSGNAPGLAGVAEAHRGFSDPERLGTISKEPGPIQSRHRNRDQFYGLKHPTNHGSTGGRGQDKMHS